MYVVCSRIAVYSDRDAFLGSAVYPIASLPAYDSLDDAQAAAQQMDAEMSGGLPDEVLIAVYQRVDGCLMPVPAQPAEDLETPF